jgi:hypothetical protein
MSRLLTAPHGTARSDRHVVAPYITAWSEEPAPPVVLVERPGVGIAYRDEVMADRDSRGVLWCRTPFRPGQGRPEFGRVHPARQRRTMQRLLCQVCAGPADKVQGWRVVAAARPPRGLAAVAKRHGRHRTTDLPCLRAVLGPVVSCLTKGRSRRSCAALSSCRGVRHSVPEWRPSTGCHRGSVRSVRRSGHPMDACHEPCPRVDRLHDDPARRSCRGVARLGRLSAGPCSRALVQAG